MKKPKVIFFGLIILLIGLLIGLLMGGGSDSVNSKANNLKPKRTTKQIYTCSMHPQIRMDKPGDCPICSMPLEPISDQEATTENMNALKLSDYALAMASVETTEVNYREINTDIKTYGDIHFDPQSYATVTARVDGYAEKIFANISGTNINAGDHLLEIYSPDILVAEQELLIALQSGKDSPLVTSSKLKLLRWGFSEKQINEVIETKKIVDVVTLYSPISGTIIEKNIIENSAFKMGDALYKIVNLDKVWAHLDIYERDLALIRKGQKVEISVEAYPGEVFFGTVSYSEPEINEMTRTMHLPVQIDNKNHKLKMGMYVSAVIKVTLDSSGHAIEPSIDGKFTCPMHPQVIADQSGNCPVCDMPLVKVVSKDSKEDNSKNGRNVNSILAIPVSAVLDSGNRKIVYIAKDASTFESRDVILGPRGGEYYPVLKGLYHGERVVTRGGFFIDSQFQIMGSPSLYYQGGLQSTTKQEEKSDGHNSGTNEKENKSNENEIKQIPNSTHKH